MSVRRIPPGNVKLLRPPRRAIRPASQRLCRPRRRLVGVTQIADVRNFHRVGLRRPHETEGVAAHHHVAEGLRDLRHVARDALAAGAARGMMGVLLDRCRMRSILRIRSVAAETKAIALLAHNPRIVGPVRIVAIRAGDAARIHQARDEIVPLHAVLVRGPVREVSETKFAELVLLELPEISQIQADVKADRPVIILALYRILRRPALRVTLDAGVAGVHVVEAGRVEDGARHRALDMRAAWPVAFLATDIPFAYLLGSNVVVDRMTAVAQRAGRPLEIVGWIKRRPPVGAVADEILLPHLVRDVPLRRLWEIIVADLGEVALLPAAAVDECDIVLGERDE